MRFKVPVFVAIGAVAFEWAAHETVMAQAPATLTAMDYIEIQQLVAKFSFALDYCTHGGKDFADLFVEGGSYAIDAGDGNPRVSNTREQLERLAGGPDCSTVKPGASEAPSGRSNVRHVSESLVIEAAPNGARGKSYAIYPANKGRFIDAETAGQVGIFIDEYVKTPSGWRFKSRVHVLTPPIG
jgi:SnoaL-like protein